jgi:hypothetical protein
VKYAVESRRLFGDWSRGAIWEVPHGKFREFLDYINSYWPTYGARSRVRRIHGDPPAKYTWPADRRGVL